MKKNNIIRAVVIGFLVVLVSFFFVYTIVDLSSYASASADSVSSSEFSSDSSESSVDLTNYPDVTPLCGVWKPKTSVSSFSSGLNVSFYASGYWGVPATPPNYDGLTRFDGKLVLYAVNSNTISLFYISESGSPIGILRGTYSNGSMTWDTSYYFYIASVTYIDSDFDSVLSAYQTYFDYVGETYMNFSPTMNYQLSIVDISIASNGVLIPVSSSSITSGDVHILFNGNEVYVHDSSDGPFTSYQCQSYGVYSLYIYSGNTYGKTSFPCNGVVYYDTDYEDGYAAGLEAGIEQGKEIGYNDGYNAGYNSGYDSGIADGFTNPIAVFLNPVDTFLSIDLFGSVSIGDILSVVLFVMVALIFIKMFAGG